MVDYPDGAHAACFQLEERSFWFAFRNRFIVETVRNFPPAGPVADIGAGNGFVAVALRDAGFPVIVIEPGVDGARNARLRGLEPVLCATLEDAGLPPRSLAAAGLFDVVEHVADDLGFLRTVHGVLEPDGRLYVTVPAFELLWSSEDDDAGHHRRYSLRSLQRVLRAAGFAVDYATYLFSPLPLPLFVMRSLPSRLGRRRAGGAAAAAEHAPSSGLAVRAISAMLEREVALVRGRRRIPFGTSCLVAARAIAG